MSKLEPNFREIQLEYLDAKRRRRVRNQKRLDPFDAEIVFLFLNLIFIFFPLYLGYRYIEKYYDGGTAALYGIILTVLYFVAPAALVGVYNAIQYFDEKLVFTSREEDEIIRILLKIFNEENISEKEQNILYKNLDTALVRGILDNVYDKETGKNFYSLAKSGKIHDHKLISFIYAMNLYPMNGRCNWSNCIFCNKRCRR